MFPSSYTENQLAKQANKQTENKETYNKKQRNSNFEGLCTITRMLLKNFNHSPDDRPSNISENGDFVRIVDPNNKPPSSEKSKL